MPRSDYVELLAKADEARIGSETARLMVERHRSRHGCQAEAEQAEETA